MRTYHPTDTARTDKLDAELDRLLARELVPAPVRRHDETVRQLRRAHLTHETPARWTRW